MMEMTRLIAAMNALNPCFSPFLIWLKPGGNAVSHTFNVIDFLTSFPGRWNYIPGLTGGFTERRSPPLLPC